MKQSRRRLLPLYRGMPERNPSGEGEARYDLLLTPQLYLMKRETLPVKFAFQARKVAPSILGELGASDSWTYEVFRENDAWIFVAYDPSEIVRLLETAGWNPAKFSQLYFAQQFAHELSHPVRLDDSYALINVDGTVTLLHSSLLGASEEKAHRLGTLTRPRQSFPFSGAQSLGWLEHKELIGISLALLLFGGAWIIEGIRYRQSAANIERQVQRATEGNPALSSHITRTNIHDKYAAIDRRQREIRETIKQIGGLVSKDSKLTLLELDAQGYHARIEAPASKLKSLQARAATLGLRPKITDEALRLQGDWQ